MEEMDNRQTLRKTTSLLKRGTQKTVKAGKSVVQKLINLLGKAISAITGFFSTLGIPAVAIVLIIAILLSLIAALLSMLSLRKNYFRVSLTPEGKEIISLFKVYTNDLYSADLNVLKNDKTDEYRFGVSWESKKFHTKSTAHDDDNDRDRYKKIMNFIEENEYEFFLCGLWKTLMYYFINYENNCGTYPKENADGFEGELYDRMTFNRHWLDHIADLDSRFQDIEQYDFYRIWYYEFIWNYERLDDYVSHTDNRIFGFLTLYEHTETSPAYDIDSIEDEISEETVWYGSPYFVKQAFKTCLDAFVDEKGDFCVPKIEALNKEIIYGSPEFTEITIESTEPTTAPSIGTKLSPDITVDQYANILAKKTRASFLRAMKTHYCPPSEAGDFMSFDLEDDIKPYFTYYYSAEETYVRFNNISDDDIVNAGGLQHYDTLLNKDIFDQTIERSMAFLIYTTDASGSAANVLALAQEQIGNDGLTYTNAYGYPEGTSWCAIYVKWLLQKGAGIDVDSEYGWNANVGKWCDSLKAKGLFHVRGDPKDHYEPKPGDIVIFTWDKRSDGTPSRDHVGIVIEIDGDVIVSNEGNTNGHVVAEHRNGPGGDRDISTIYGYGEVTYLDINLNYTPRLTAPQKGDKYYDTNENPFKVAGYGMFENYGNCVAYAWARAYEILGTAPDLSTASARYWYPENKEKHDANKNKGYSYGNTPKAGAILCLSDGGYGNGGHVAVVEQINSDGSIVTSESGWNSFYFKTRTRYSADNYTNGGNYTFQGFIYVYDESVGRSYSPQKISPNEAQKKIYTFFTTHGFNKAATCGIMANVMAECGFDSNQYFAGYVPDALGAPGNSGGICMWYDDNCDRFKRDCPAWYYSFDAQVDYLYHTLLNDGQGSPSTKYYYYCRGCLNKLKSAPNTLAGAEQAAIDFHDYYERSAFSGSERTGWAKTFWNSF